MQSPFKIVLFGIVSFDEKILEELIRKTFITSSSNTFITLDGNTFKTKS
jgi:hypothetical protein